MQGFDAQRLPDLHSVVYLKSEDSLNFIASYASVNVYNVQTKGIQQKSMVKPALKTEGYTSGQFRAL